MKNFIQINDIHELQVKVEDVERDCLKNISQTIKHYDSNMNIIIEKIYNILNNKPTNEELKEYVNNLNTTISDNTKKIRDNRDSNTKLPSIV
jgi:hypothetical protein